MRQAVAPFRICRAARGRPEPDGLGMDRLLEDLSR